MKNGIRLKEGNIDTDGTRRPSRQINVCIQTAMSQLYVRSYTYKKTPSERHVPFVSVDKESVGSREV